MWCFVVIETNLVFFIQASGQIKWFFEILSWQGWEFLEGFKNDAVMSWTRLRVLWPSVGFCLFFTAHCPSMWVLHFALPSLQDSYFSLLTWASVLIYSLVSTVVDLTVWVEKWLFSTGNKCLSCVTCAIFSLLFRLHQSRRLVLNFVVDEKGKWRISQNDFLFYNFLFIFTKILLWVTWMKGEIRFLDMNRLNSSHLIHIQHCFFSFVCCWETKRTFICFVGRLQELRH